MKIVQFIFIFAIAFIISFLLVNTFSQEAFRVSASIKLLGYYSRAMPIYYYVAGSFILGLAIGLLILVYYFFTTTAENIRKNKKIKLLEQEIETLVKSHPEQIQENTPTVVSKPDVQNLNMFSDR